MAGITTQPMLAGSVVTACLIAGCQQSTQHKIASNTVAACRPTRTALLGQCRSANSQGSVLTPRNHNTHRHSASSHSVSSQGKCITPASCHRQAETNSHQQTPKGQHALLGGYSRATSELAVSASMQLTQPPSQFYQDLAHYDTPHTYRWLRSQDQPLALTTCPAHNSEESSSATQPPPADRPALPS